MRRPRRQKPTIVFLDAMLAALAEPTRRGIIDLLSRGPRRAGELAQAFRLSPPAMSKHLRLLLKQGLVEEARAEHDARQRVFGLRRERFAELSTWLAAVAHPQPAPAAATPPNAAPKTRPAPRPRRTKPTAGKSSPKRARQRTASTRPPSVF